MYHVDTKFMIQGDSLIISDIMVPVKSPWKLKE